MKKLLLGWVISISMVTGLLAQTPKIDGNGVVTNIKAFEKKTEIDFSGKKLKDISNFKYLKNVKILNLFGNNEIKDFTALKYLKNVVELTLEDTNISDSTPLKYMKKLEILNLKGCSGLKELKGIKSLRSLKTYLCHRP